MWNWMSAAGRPAARAHEGDDLGDGRGQRPGAAQHPLGQRTSACRRRTACPCRRPPRCIVTNGWSWRLRPDARQRRGGRLDAGRAQLLGAGRCPTAAAAAASRSRRPRAAPRARRAPLARRAAPRAAHAGRAVALELDARAPSRRCAPRGSARFSAGRRKASAALKRRPLRWVTWNIDDAVLLGAVVVGDARDPRRLAGREQAPVQRPRRALLGDAAADRRRRGTPTRRARCPRSCRKYGQHVVAAPARRALRLPGVVVQRAAAHVEHRVHRARAAEALAARDVQRAPVDVRLGLGREVPVELGVELVGERGRDLDVGRAVPAAGLEQQHADRRVLGQAVGEHAAGRAGADDHVVKPLHEVVPRSGRPRNHNAVTTVSSEENCYAA